MTYARLRRLPFPRRWAMDDLDLLQELLAQNVPAVRAGWCDWLDDTAAVQVNVGWAWYVTRGDASRRWAPGGISSNIMLTTAAGRDRGRVASDRLLLDWFATQTWADACVARMIDGCRIHQEGYPLVTRP